MTDVEQNNSGPQEGDELFAPFSVLTSDMTTYDHRDPVFVSLRDLVATKAFSGLEAEQDRVKRLSSRAIGALVQLTNPHFTEFWWYRDRVGNAEACGFEIHEGHGVTFAEPSRIARSFQEIDLIGIKSVEMILNFARAYAGPMNEQNMNIDTNIDLDNF